MFKSESIILEFTVWEFHFWILLDKLLLKLKVHSTSDFQKTTALYTKERKHKKERKRKRNLTSKRVCLKIKLLKCILRFL